MLGSSKPVLFVDTNVFLDVIAGLDDNDASKSKNVLKLIQNGTYRGIIASPILSEIYIIMSRKISKDAARDFLKRILSTPNMETFPIGREEAIRAGEISTRYNSNVKPGKGLSFVDCCIVSIASYVDTSRIVTWDGRFSQIKEIEILKPSDFTSAST